LEFAKRYAREHGMTVTELIDRYLRTLQANPKLSIHPVVERISGLVPSGIDGEADYREHLLEKHR
jgi:hypothetical protein